MKIKIKIKIKNKKWKMKNENENENENRKIKIEKWKMKIENRKWKWSSISSFPEKSRYRLFTYFLQKFSIASPWRCCNILHYGEALMKVRIKVNPKK